MTAKIINLNRARKAKARDDKAVIAEENRIKFGRTKAERQLTEARHDMAERTLDGAQRETGDEDSDPSGSST